MHTLPLIFVKKKKYYLMTLEIITELQHFKLFIKYKLSNIVY